MFIFFDFLFVVISIAIYRWPLNRRAFRFIFVLSKTTYVCTGMIEFKKVQCKKYPIYAIQSNIFKVFKNNLSNQKYTLVHNSVSINSCLIFKINILYTKVKIIENVAR